MFHYSWQIDINVPPQVMLDMMADIHTGEKTAPFALRDPNMTYGFRGPDKGVGAIYWWIGNNKVGSGQVEIVEVTDRAVIARQTLAKPYRVAFSMIYTAEPLGSGTRFTCAMQGRHPLFLRILCLLFNCKKTQDAHFHETLTFLKREAENRV